MDTHKGTDTDFTGFLGSLSSSPMNGLLGILYWFANISTYSWAILDHRSLVSIWLGNAPIRCSSLQCLIVAAEE